jgi:hypothetical protein
MIKTHLNKSSTHVSNDNTPRLQSLPTNVNVSSSNNDEITAVLMANNEVLMRELHELKSASTQMIALNQRISSSPQVSENVQSTGSHQQLSNQHTNNQKSSVRDKKPPQHHQPQHNTPQPYSSQKSDIYNLTVTPGPQTPFGYSYGHETPVDMDMSMRGLGITLNGPATPHGKNLLAKNLSQLKLPPEEWAQDVKELNGQLIECLEQLYEREEEVEEQRGIIDNLEDNLIGIKQQMATIYYDYASKADSWESKEKSYKSENKSLIEKLESFRLKLSDVEKLNAVLQKEDQDCMEAKLTELSRKVTIYEVNEATLTRKFIAQSEQLDQEHKDNQTLEADFAEMETTLKMRILYLEQYKAASSSRLGYLQGKLDTSIAQEDYFALQSELECLREDHLSALNREVESRLIIMKSQEQSRELRSNKIANAHIQSELTACKSNITSLQQQLNHQIETNALALSANNSSSELAAIVSEMARFRGEASRLEVEVVAGKRRNELLNDQITSMTTEIDENADMIQELKETTNLATIKEDETRRSLLETKLMFEGGLNREETELLKTKHEKNIRELEEMKREKDRYREMSEIATLQAQTINSFRDHHQKELKELREHCTKLESRGDDDILIGRLQRQIMSTKTSYQAFVRKYQILRGNMRQRELALRVLETRLDQREEAALKTAETHRLEISALKKALRNLNQISTPEIDFNSKNGDNNKENNQNKSQNKLKKVNSTNKSIDLSGDNLIGSLQLTSIGM